MSGGAPRRSLLAPEVIQTSAMDCGPAALSCLLAGFGIHAHYGRLREACQTSVDGTSIDSLEEIARLLGLEAEQVLVPNEHLLLPEAGLLPAIVILRQQGLNHVVVVWRRVGRWVQVMDPARGRRWLRASELVRELYSHEHELEASDWREWAGAEEQKRVLQARLTRLGARRSAGCVDWADADPTWRSYAALDAALRLAEALVDARALARDARAVSLVQELAASAARGGHAPEQTIPPQFWSVRPSPRQGQGEHLVMRGAVLLTASGGRQQAGVGAQGEPPEPLPRELSAALEQPRERPARELWRLVREEGLYRPLALVAGLVLSAAGVTAEALLFRVLIDVQGELALSWQRIGALGALAVLLAALLLLQQRVMRGLTQLGRHLEARFRVAFLRKVPRLGVDFFHSRLISDMATRCHNVDTLRTLPQLAAGLIEVLARMVLTTAAMVWFYPASAPWAIALVVGAIATPLLLQSSLGELEMRVRIHATALSRGYLDCLLGLFALRAHNGERTQRREHEALLVSWSHAARALNRAEIAMDGAQALVGLGGAVALLAAYLAQAPGDPGVLLLAYWALQLPVQGRALALRVREYPAHRNITLRLLEPCNAPEQEPPRAPPEPRQAQPGPEAGLAIEFKDVRVLAGGHSILTGVSVSIEAGSHVAIVGRSGSGKSTLVGTLLSWHRAMSGQVRVDGQPLEDYGVARLREQIAWLDPAVQLWNRSLLENLAYGLPAGAAPDLARVLDGARLHSVLKSLPQGLQTPLGDSGGLLSGGQAQRVRIGRALLRTEARLVILDEPFRGLERAQRRELLRQLRAWWPRATLLCISHDVGDTLEFERVLVMDGGRVREDGAPRALAAQPDSLYAALLKGEQQVEQEVWGDARWRRLWVADGRVSPSGEPRG